MTLENLRQSRDKSSPVRTYLFETGGAGVRRFAYTDGPTPISLNASNRVRLALTLDCGASMAARNRFAIAKSVIVRILDIIQNRLSSGEIWDLHINTYGAVGQSSSVTEYDVNPTTIATLKQWVNGRVLNSEESHLDVAVSSPVSWFSTTGMSAKKRDWILFTSGESVNSDKAFSVARDIILGTGDTESDYIPTKIYVCTVNNADARGVEFLGNTIFGSGINIETYNDARVFSRALANGVEQIVYQPWAIDLSSPKISGMVSDKASLTIVMGKNCPLADYYKVNDPSSPMFVTIREGEYEDEDKQFPYAWVGRVVSCKRFLTTPKIELVCEPITVNFKRTGLRRHYQYTCPHELFGDLCRASKAAASKTFTAESMGWTTLPPGVRSVPVPSSLTVEPEPWIGGTVEWTLTSGVIERATILRVNETATTFVLSKPILEPSAITSVRIVYGCARTPTFCAKWHVESSTLKPNICNFGGQDLIPMKNPFKFVNRYN